MAKNAEKGGGQGRGEIRRNGDSKNNEYKG